MAFITARGGPGEAIEPAVERALQVCETRSGRTRMRAMIERFIDRVTDDDIDGVLQDLRDARKAEMPARLQDPADPSRWKYIMVRDWATTLTADRLLLACIGLPSKDVADQMPGDVVQMSAADRVRDLESIGVEWMGVIQALKAKTQQERRAESVDVASKPTA